MSGHDANSRDQARFFVSTPDYAIYRRHSGPWRAAYQAPSSYCLPKV